MAEAVVAAVETPDGVDDLEGLEPPASVIRRKVHRAPATRLYNLTALGIIAVGAVLRAVDYGSRLPLTIDEARVALNLGTRSLWGLVQPLDHNQAAPLPFLWGEWIIARLGGYSEFALRAIPFICGLLILPLLWLTGRRLLGRREAIVATAFAALSTCLIYYGNQVKQYGVDALVTVVILGLAAQVLNDPASRRAWRNLAIGGVLALFTSQPAVFVIAGVGAALIVQAFVRRNGGRVNDSPLRDRPLVRRTLGVAALWAVTFAILYVAIDRKSAADPYLHRYWESTFLTLGAPDFGWRVHTVLHFALVDPFYFSTVSSYPFSGRGIIVLPLFIGGFAAVAYRRGWPVAIALLGPYVAAGIAIVAGLYPGGSRVLLFLAPILFLSCAAAVVAIADALAALVTRRATSPETRRMACWVACAIVLVLTFAWRAPAAMQYVWDPPRPDDGRRLVRSVQQASDRDPVYIFASAIPEWFFYTTYWDAPDLGRLDWMAPLVASGGPAFENAPSRGRQIVPGTEGRYLSDRYQGRTELLGIPTGGEARAAVPDIRLHADSGWAQNEAKRLRAAAHPHIWVFADHAYTYALAPLLGAIWQCGGVIESEESETDAALYRVRFGPGTVATSSWCQ